MSNPTKDERVSWAVIHRMTDEQYIEFWVKRVKSKCTETESGCWVWSGHITHKGYGQTTFRGSGNVMIHRQIYKLFHQVSLPTEQFVCHICDVRRCCNPEHLFLGDAKANNQDCGGKGRHHNSVKTHCPRGHEYTVENTYITPTGLRNCRQCGRERSRREWQNGKAIARQRLYRARLKAQGAA